MRSVPARQVLWILWFSKWTAIDDMCTGAGIGLVCDQEEPIADTALHLAAVRGVEADILRLLEQGADVNARGHEHTTPLMALLSCYCVEWSMDLQHVVEQMIAAGADLNAVDKNNKTALRRSVDRIEVPSSICITLIEAGHRSHLSRAHRLEPYATGRHRRHGCRLGFGNRIARGSNSRKNYSSAEVTGARRIGQCKVCRAAHPAHESSAQRL